VRNHNNTPTLIEAVIVNKKILLIDDDKDILFILERWLRDSGFTNVQSTTSGSEAIEALKQDWGLIVTDVFLPDLDGIDFAQLVREKELGCRILVMTGSLNTEVTLRALDTRIDGFLPKPINREKFISKVTEQLKHQLKDSSQQSKQRVLAIGAHPDDVEIGCGGILIGHRNVGDEIGILTLSNGKCGGDTNTRVEESRQAAEILGATLIMEDLEDTKISEGAETIQVITDAIREFQPDIVYTHSKNDAHQDHRNCHRATVVSARSVPRLQSYQSPSSTIQFMPSRFVDISKAIEEKKELIACYRTQTEKCRYLKESLITSTAEYWGRFAGFGIVEPLEVIRTI
jgi:LmbE family N-acetylglucosaminyl deacetylase